MIMNAPYSRGLVMAGIALLLTLHGTSADTLQVVKSNPEAGATVDAANSNQFEIRFSGLLDPRHSTLSVSRNGQVAETLHPTLDASPGVLFARGPRLAQGDSKLHWSVKSLNDTDVTEGDIAFSVK